VTGLAFYDFDGTLVSSNVVDQYLWYARRAGWWRIARALALAPRWLAAEAKSRRLFNEIFFREYRGLRRDWMDSRAAEMCDAILVPALFRGARALIQRDRGEGYRTVLVTGSLDFAIAPFLARIGMDEAITNRLEFRDGVATGALIEPIIAGAEKVAAMARLQEKYNVESARCKAYSDSFSDAPMLEAVGIPAAANPDRRLRALAVKRGWPILNLKGSDHVDPR
jgi:HAD superfamily hydrolase (TIGR01490 family)